MNVDITNFNETIEKMTKMAIDSSLAYTKQISQSMIQDVQRELENRIKPQTLTIKVDSQPLKKLVHPAVPFLDRMIINAKLGLNTLLVGPAGSGKSFSANQLAEALDLQFGHICLTAGASETWLFGRQTPNGFIEGVFSKLYKNGGVFLADEFDAADPNLLLSINTALANNSLYNPISGEEIKRHDNFVFVGACNTFGKGGDHIYTGRNRLDAATLDRFIMIQVAYNESVEELLCPDNELRLTLQQVRAQLKTMGSDEVISTRAIAAAYKQAQAGVKVDDILQSITSSWPIDLQNIMAKTRESVKKAVKARR
jgi:cobaltochelatase CobS